MSSPYKITELPIAWKGDLSADCSARWRGLKLLARQIEEGGWYWGVYDMRTFEEVLIDRSTGRQQIWTEPGTARAAAESAARQYLQSDRIKKPDGQKFDRLLFTASSILVAVLTALTWPSAYGKGLHSQPDPFPLIAAGLFHLLTFPVLRAARLVSTDVSFASRCCLQVVNCILYGFLIERMFFLVKKRRHRRDRQEAGIL